MPDPNTQQRIDSYLNTLGFLIKDAAKHDEVIVIGFYHRDPKIQTSINPMGETIYTAFATPHNEYDRIMFPSLMQQMMNTLMHQDNEKKVNP